MRRVAAAIRGGRFWASGQTTQFVVGAAGESDRDLATAAWNGYRTLGLARVYYSAMQPVPGTPSAELAPTPFLREHRLYQADFLLRSYGFALDELPFEPGGALSLDADPKTVWARQHPERFPVELNRAPLRDLMRVPGIGPRSARELLRMRGQGKLRDLSGVRAAGAAWKVAAPYLLLDGKPAERQLRLGPGW